MRTVRYMWQIYNFFANFAVKQHHHMDSTPSKSYSHGELSRLINAALLRDDTPAPGKIANKIYNDIMMGSGAFARVSRMIETEAMHLISRDLPPSLLGSPSSQTNITEALHPDIRIRIETEFKQYLNSETVRSEVGTIYNELCDSIERAGWSFGIVNLARALEILRDKIRKQANVYNSSIALVGPYTDLGPLYEAACCKTNVHGNHYVDIQDFYTALCDNTRTGCTDIHFLPRHTPRSCRMATSTGNHRKQCHTPRTLQGHSRSKCRKTEMPCFLRSRPFQPNGFGGYLSF